MSPTNFQDQVVLITGGSSGIGLATARLLRACGARVVLLARTFPGELGADDGCLRITADVRDHHTLRDAAAEIQREFGTLDALFVNAGVAGFAKVQEADEAHFDRIFDTNVRGAFLTTRAFLPLLSSGGSIVFTSSVAATIGSPWCTIYGASKGAIEAFARSLAAELLDRGIRVNCVSPGPTETPILAKAATPDSANADFGPFIYQRMRMGRLGQATEIAEAAAFLLSKRASFITGQVLAVDGGMSGI